MQLFLPADTFGVKLVWGSECMCRGKGVEGGGCSSSSLRDTVKKYLDIFVFACLVLP